MKDEVNPYEIIIEKRIEILRRELAAHDTNYKKCHAKIEELEGLEVLVRASKDHA